MSAKSLSAGDYIAARCTRCKDQTNHTIVAMVGDKVVKVECNICGSKHNYHQVKSSKSTINRGTKDVAGKPRATKSRRDWEESLAGAQPEEAIVYRPATPMVEGMLIRHPSFGLGRVLRTTKPNKMEVRFADGVKLLRCTIG